MYVCMYIHVFAHKLTINSISWHCILIGFFKSLISKAYTRISCASTFFKGATFVIKNCCKVNQ